jgi:hypothetical protein
MKGYDPGGPGASRSTGGKELLSKAGHAQGLTLSLVYNSAVTFDAEWRGDPE